MLFVIIITIFSFCVSVSFWCTAVSRISEVVDGHTVCHNTSLCPLRETQWLQAAVHVSILHPGSNVAYLCYVTSCYMPIVVSLLHYTLPASCSDWSSELPVYSAVSLIIILFNSISLPKSQFQHNVALFCVFDCKLFFVCAYCHNVVLMNKRSK